MRCGAKVSRRRSRDRRTRSPAAGIVVPRGGPPPKFDKQIYKTRNTVERAINRLRGYRAMATMYDKREFVYKGTIDVASIGIWLRKRANQDPGDTASAASSLWVRSDLARWEDTAE